MASRAVGKKFVDFAVTEVGDGFGTKNISDFIGDTPLILCFYTSWCASCHVAVTELATFAASGKATCILINVEGKGSAEVCLSLRPVPLVVARPFIIPPPRLPSLPYLFTHTPLPPCL